MIGQFDVNLHHDWSIRYQSTSWLVNSISIYIMIGQFGINLHHDWLLRVDVVVKDGITVDSFSFVQQQNWNQEVPSTKTCYCGIHCKKIKINKQKKKDFIKIIKILLIYFCSKSIRRSSRWSRFFFSFLFTENCISQNFAFPFKAKTAFQFRGDWKLKQ